MSAPGSPDRPIGWYVHHQGFGHLVRASAVAAEMPEMVVLSSLPRPEGWERGWIELPRDDEGEAVEVEAGGVLHWAPLGDDGLRARMAAIAGWIEEARPAAFVVDVSVEVALLARLHGVPTVIVGQRGRRDDLPHSLAFASATSVVVPWTEATHLPDQGLPDDRLVFLGAISRFEAATVAVTDDAAPPDAVVDTAPGVDPPVAITSAGAKSAPTDAGSAGAAPKATADVGAASTPTDAESAGAAPKAPAGASTATAPPKAAVGGGDVLVLLGFGGSSLGAEQIVTAAAETPERTWHLAGPIRASGPPNLVDHGPDAPVGDLLARASVVVGAAGGSTIAEVAAARRHFLCVPERRPFEEQRHGAIALGPLGAAEVRTDWPGAGEWRAALAAAESRPIEPWAQLEDGRGAERMAAAVRAVALR